MGSPFGRRNPTTSKGPQKERQAQMKQRFFPGVGRTLKRFVRETRGKKAYLLRAPQLYLHPNLVCLLGLTSLRSHAQQRFKNAVSHMQPVRFGMWSSRDTLPKESKRRRSWIVGGLKENNTNLNLVLAGLYRPPAFSSLTI